MLLLPRELISLLIRVMSDANPSEIYSSDFTFIDDIGLSTHLSPTRANGLVSMVKQMKLYAKALYLRAEK